MKREEIEAELKAWQMRWQRLCVRAYNESPFWRSLNIHQDDHKRREVARTRIDELEKLLSTKIAP